MSYNYSYIELSFGEHDVYVENVSINPFNKLIVRWLAFFTIYCYSKYIIHTKVNIIEIFKVTRID